MVYLVNVDLRLLGHPIKSALSFLFLNLEGDALDGAALNSLDEMGGESCDLVSKALGGNLGDFRENLFVDVEVVGQLLVVLFEQHLSGTLDCFGSHSAHCGSKYTNILLKSK